jgi:hypothetical protein
MTLWFVRTQKELDHRIETISRGMGQALWIAWPKRASGVQTDVTEALVRAAGLAHGLVDYKICAINETWSGLKFARRRDRS